VRIARRRGIDAKVIEAILAGRIDDWPAPILALVRAVDALVTTQDLDDARWDALREHYDERRIIEVCLLVGHYEMLATTITALRVERDFTD
jgi:alkylhydroperoxidase family enzyme